MTTPPHVQIEVPSPGRSLLPPSPELLDGRAYLRYYLWLDWPRLPLARARRLNEVLHRYDWDFGGNCDEGAFQDGIRARWRKPLLTLRETLAIVGSYGVREVRGFYVPTGWNCPGYGFDPDDVPLPKLGDSDACDGHPTTADWWAATLDERGVR